jgi:ABC-2 type transport system ATP-binding protein
VIEARGLTKSYGGRLAVDHLDLDVRPGRVTGFLGPNGSGKSTTMRCLLQLDRVDEGWATFNGVPYRSLASPLRDVGALLDAGYVHPGRTARAHLWAVAASNGLPKQRVGEVLEMVGLTEVARHRVKGFSLGMRQRLGLAAVMLGDPHTLILDEPANGLDPEGIRWIREFLSYLARQGRTVFVSSHLLSEMALMADHLVVIGQGRLIEECSVADLVDRYARRWVRVRSPDLARLVQLARTAGATVAPSDGDAAELHGVTSAAVGEIAASHGIVLHELSPQTGSLEDAFLEVTRSAQEYRAAATPLPAVGPAPGSSLPPPTAGPPQDGVT